jgi:Rod binding domain-containing protein
MIGGVSTIGGHDRAALREAGLPGDAGTAVEGMFASMLVAEMTKSLSGGGLFGDGPGSDVFQGMFTRLLGEELAKQGGFGLADFVARELKAPRTEHQAPPPAADLEGAGTTPVTTP